MTEPLEQTTHGAASMAITITQGFDSYSRLQKRCWQMALEDYVATVPNTPLDLADAMPMMEDLRKRFVRAMLDETTTAESTCKRCGQPVYEQNESWFHAYGARPEMLALCRAASYNDGQYDETLKKTWRAMPTD